MIFNADFLIDKVPKEVVDLLLEAPPRSLEEVRLKATAFDYLFNEKESDLVKI